MSETYLGAELVLVTEWVKDQLALPAIVAALNAINAGLATRVHEDVAPPNEPYPFIVIQCQVPPRDIRGVGETRVMVDTLYVVKAVAQGSSYAPLVPVAKVIDTALTSPQGGVGSPDGLVFTSIRQNQFALTTVEQGTQFRHLGGEYKIQAQA